MTIATGIEAHGDSAMVVKRATGADADQLRLEGERLRRASHPGVVEVVVSEPSDGGWELRTVHAGRPLSILDRPAVVQAAAIVAAVASTLADLHLLGVVHGRLDASHVLLGDHGRPVLCGFGAGIEPAVPADDVAALGALLDALLGADADPEPIPERRWRGRRGWSGWDRRALLLLADQACAEPATRRPTARRLAAAITEAVPDMARFEAPAPPLAERALDQEVDPLDRLRASAIVEVGRPVLRPAAIAIAVLGAILLVAGAAQLGGGAAHDEAVPLAGVQPTASPLATEVTSPLATEVASATTDSTAAGVASGAGTAVVRTAVALSHSELTVEGQRYRVGQAGDEVLLADWNCDGEPTPALLRPATAEVFVFPRWAEQAPLSVRPLLLVPGAEALVSEVTPGGCPTLAVRTSAGALVPVIEAAAR